MTGPLLTAHVLADLLGVSSETVLRWTRRGDLPALRLPGGAIRYRADEIDAWLAQRAIVADTRLDKSSAPAPLERPGAWSQGETP